jgi:hypothetical protein
LLVTGNGGTEYSFISARALGTLEVVAVHREQVLGRLRLRLVDRERRVHGVQHLLDHHLRLGDDLPFDVDHPGATSTESLPTVILTLPGGLADGGLVAAQLEQSLDVLDGRPLDLEGLLEGEHRLLGVLGGDGALRVDQLRRHLAEQLLLPVGRGRRDRHRVDLGGVFEQADEARDRRRHARDRPRARVDFTDVHARSMVFHCSSSLRIGVVPVRAPAHVVGLWPGRCMDGWQRTARRDSTGE